MRSGADDALEGLPPSSVIGQPPSSVLSEEEPAADDEDAHSVRSDAAPPPLQESQFLTALEAESSAGVSSRIPLNGFRCAVCDHDFMDSPPGHCIECSGGVEDDAVLSGGGWLCRSCYSAHRRSMFPNHVATPAQDWLTTERRTVLATLGARAPPPTLCMLHRSAPNPTLSLYCIEHNELVCAECVSEQHAGPGHSFVAASQAAASCRCVCSAQTALHGMTVMQQLALSRLYSLLLVPECIS